MDGKESIKLLGKNEGLNYNINLPFFLKTNTVHFTDHLPFSHLSRRVRERMCWGGLQIGVPPVPAPSDNARGSRRGADDGREAGARALLGDTPRGGTASSGEIKVLTTPNEYLPAQKKNNEGMRGQWKKSCRLTPDSQPAARGQGGNS